MGSLRSPQTSHRHPEHPVQEAYEDHSTSASIPRILMPTPRMRRHIPTHELDSSQYSAQPSLYSKLTKSTAFLLTFSGFCTRSWQSAQSSWPHLQDSEQADPPAMIVRILYTKMMMSTILLPASSDLPAYIPSRICIGSLRNQQSSTQFCMGKL